MSSITVRQAVLSDLEELAVLFNKYREFQGQAGDLPAAVTAFESALRADPSNQTASENLAKARASLEKKP